MKKFIIEREVPGLGKMSPEELVGVTANSCSVVDGMGKPYHWVQSFITDDKMYCVHIAENEDVVRKHAELGGFPINSIKEVKTMIDPATH